MKKNSKNKGITLIALVITIIVMLILVAVTISMAVNGGLFDYARRATGEMKNAINDEQALGEGKIKIGETWYNSIDEYLGTENKIQIGDYVEYDAGIWDASSISEVEGVEIGASRNDNVDLLTEEVGYMYPFDYMGDYSGWRIWDISEDEATVILISAGCPEYYTYNGSEWTDYRYSVELWLTGTTVGTAYSSDVRDWSMYVNSNQHATSARTITKNDIDLWYNKYIDNTIEDSEEVNFPLNTENNLISVLDNDYAYWVATPGSDFNYFYLMNPESRTLEEFNIYYDHYSMGIRILVNISDATFEMAQEKVIHDGFEYNKWIIK